MHDPSWLALVMAVLAFAVAAWIVVPPSAYPFLVVAVVAPELSPWLLTLSALAAGFASIGFRRSRVARIAPGLAASAAVLAAIPLVQFPVTVRRFDRAMNDALGR